ncbi:alpha/beta fold hydrolase [Foetidibacter luteolus]|uniref:alpha/beta fold hydrolase n=1 Tax=Foetidibacter luteolus TaxID=2608880 RepID=UPI00129C0FB0|nr:alpha/beta hydrolase [Foetidibacter luteolus]
MPYMKAGSSFSAQEVNLYYEDLGQGQPVIFIHGWPLCGDMWEYQVTELVKHNVRCVTYDRRGFGKSSRPLDGYDYDTLAADLKSIIDGLQLNNVVLVGFSMGGGEVVRYLQRYGSRNISKVVLISAVTPYMLKTEDNPEGVDEEVFAEMLINMQTDRIGFLDSFGKQFFGINLLNHPVSSPLLEYYRDMGAQASPIATQECAKAFAQTDFRAGMAAVNVPALVIHGDSDKTVPIDASGNRSADMLPHCQYIIYEGAPHGLFYTHRHQLNGNLLEFINGTQVSVQNAVPADSVILPSNYPI